MNAIKTCILCMVAIALMGCNPENGLLGGSSTNGKFDVTFYPGLQNTIYTSTVFGLAEVERHTNQAIDFFYINFEAENNGTIEIVIEESALNYRTEITQKVKAGMNTFAPKLKWKYEALKQMAQPGWVDLSFLCLTPKGEKIGAKTIKARYTSINECVFAAKLDGKVYPLYFLLGSYINEDSPVIDRFLKDVLKTTNLSGFFGYQGSSEDVVKQVMAMFLTLRTKGVKYSSITDTSNNRDNPNIGSQYIRFADEIMNNTQANCADGTVFLCSALQKIGIHTVMIFQPGHVYLGYYLDANKQDLIPLETTMIGSNATFEQATTQNIRTIQANKDKYTNDDYWDGYFMIDVSDIRKIIKPIGR